MKEIKERLAEDQVPDLVTAYNANRENYSGHVVSDLAKVWKELVSWTTIEETEMKIPFGFSKKVKGPITCRIWALSRRRSEVYYAGEFFDCQYTGTKRIRRMACRLSQAAVDFFERYEVVVTENKPIEVA